MSSAGTAASLLDGSPQGNTRGIAKVIDRVDNKSVLGITGGDDTVMVIFNKKIPHNIYLWKNDGFYRTLI